MSGVYVMVNGREIMWLWQIKYGYGTINLGNQNTKIKFRERLWLQFKNSKHQLLLGEELQSPGYTVKSTAVHSSQI